MVNLTLTSLPSSSLIYRSFQNFTKGIILIQGLGSQPIDLISYLQ